MPFQFVAQGPMQLPAAAGGTSAAYTNFIARSSGLDNSHKNAYGVLLDGLTTDGVFDGSGNTTLLDAFYVFATQDATNAVLNLVKNSFNCTANGGITFTANAGYTGVDADATKYLDTGFKQNSGLYGDTDCHLMVWNNTNGISAEASIGSVDGGSVTEIFTKFTDNKIYGFIQENNGGNSLGVAISDPRGYLAAVRTGVSTQKLYQGIGGTLNDISPASVTFASRGIAQNIYICARNNGGAASGSGQQIMAASIGIHLTSGQATSIYGRINTYLQTIAGISY